MPEFLDTPTPEAYPCATFGCDKRAIRVRVTATGSLLGECADHGPDHPGDSYAVLRASWDKALAAYRVNDSERNNEAEQAAWDALIDYVEAHDLNYTEYDPREQTGGGS